MPHGDGGKDYGLHGREWSKNRAPGLRRPIRHAEGAERARLSPTRNARASRTAATVANLRAAVRVHGLTGRRVEEHCTTNLSRRSRRTLVRPPPHAQHGGADCTGPRRKRLVEGGEFDAAVPARHDDDARHVGEERSGFKGFRGKRGKWTERPHIRILGCFQSRGNYDPIWTRCNVPRPLPVFTLERGEHHGKVELMRLQELRSRLLVCGQRPREGRRMLLRPDVHVRSELRMPGVVRLRCQPGEVT